jgi:hypothetical protein
MSNPIDHLKKLAKGLLQQARTADPEACGRARQLYSDYRILTNVALSQWITLGRAQHVIAVEHGFANWEAVATSAPAEVHQAISERRGKARKLPTTTRTAEPKPHKAKAEKAGGAFERLAAAVQKKLDSGATVEWNEFIGGRQLDATVRGRLGSTGVFVVIECREYDQKLGVSHVDALDSVRRELAANKAILVTRTGFTKPALKKAAKVGIDTCILRPSKDDDHPGPGAPLRRISLTVQPIGTNIRELEVEFVDGTRRPCGLFYQLEDADGNREFIDRIIKGWLQEDHYKHPNNTPLHLELTPPPKLLLDGEQPLVAKLHCVPDTGPADFSVRSIWEAPEEWVFVQLTPAGAVDERHFFEFPELEALADQFKKAQ